jgi:hypothetical protein
MSDELGVFISIFDDDVGFLIIDYKRKLSIEY